MPVPLLVWRGHGIQGRKAVYIGHPAVSYVAKVVDKRIPHWILFVAA